MDVALVVTGDRMAYVPLRESAMLVGLAVVLIVATTFVVERRRVA